MSTQADHPTCARCAADPGGPPSPVRLKLARRVTSDGKTMIAWLCPSCGASGQKAAPGTQWLSHQDVWDMIMKAQAGRQPGQVRSPFDVVPSLPMLP